MRGKYKNSAEARQAREDWERRALAAERRADKAEGELVELRLNTDRQILSLRTEMAQIADQRDKAVTPEIVRLNKLIGKLGAERDAVRGSLDRARKAARHMSASIAPILRVHGLTEEAIAEIGQLISSYARIDNTERSMLRAQADASLMRHASQAISK